MAGDGGWLRWLAVVVCIALLGGQFVRTFTAIERYGYLADIMPSDWRATNIWLDSSDCTVKSGAWLAVCEDGRLIPIADRALADDPGHALMLNIWSAITGKRATLPDAARINVLVDALGLLALSMLLVWIGSPIAALVLMLLGPVEYLGWMGLSPHWAFIGAASLAAILPLALAATVCGLLTRRAGAAWITFGIAMLAFVTLLRESIGLMGFAVTVLTLACMAWRRAARPSHVVLLFVLTVLSFLTPRWTVMARDALFDVEPAQRLERHGLSHILYLGLGFMENKWGIRYDDAYGEELARQLRPDIEFCSPEYFQLMWRLYFERLVEDPAEIARLYYEKARVQLGAPTVQPGPNFGFVLAAGLFVLVLAGRPQVRRYADFPQGKLLAAVSVAFLGLYLAQAMTALPSPLYAVPANAFVLVLAGTIAEFAARALWSVGKRSVSPRRCRRATLRSRAWLPRYAPSRRRRSRSGRAARRGAPPAGGGSGRGSSPP